MADYHLIGASNYLDASDYVVYVYLDPTGYPEGEYGSRPIETYGDTNDPFWSLGLDTETMASGQQQLELGLLDSYRIKYTASGIYGWHEDSGSGWIDMFAGAGGGGDNLGDHSATQDLDLNYNLIHDTIITNSDYYVKSFVDRLDNYLADGDTRLGITASYSESPDSGDISVLLEGNYNTREEWIDASTSYPVTITLENIPQVHYVRGLFLHFPWGRSPDDGVKVELWDNNTAQYNTVYDADPGTNYKDISFGCAGDYCTKVRITLKSGNVAQGRVWLGYVGLYGGYNPADLGGYYVTRMGDTMYGDLSLGTGTVITSADEDLAFTFGQNALHSASTGLAHFSHRNQVAQATGYAIRQTGVGYTYVNAADGKSLMLRINNVDKAVITATEMTMSVPIAMGSNKITGLTAGGASGEAVEFDQLHSEYTDADAVSAVETAGLTMGNPIDMAGNNLTSSATFDIETTSGAMQFRSADDFDFFPLGYTTDYLRLYGSSNNIFLRTYGAADFYLDSDDLLVLRADANIRIHPDHASSVYAEFSNNGTYITISTNTGDLYLEPAGDIRSSKKIYNSVYNDYADFIPLAKGEIKKPGMCYYETGEGLAICNKKNQLGAFGICSDTYGYATGVEKRGVPISVAGIVLAYIDKIYKPGTILINNKHGFLTKAKKRERYNALAMFMKKETKTKTKSVWVKGRHWVKVK